MTENVETPGKAADETQRRGLVEGEVEVREESSSSEADGGEGRTMDTDLSDLLSSNDLDDIRSGSSRSRRFGFKLNVFYFR